MFSINIQEKGSEPRRMAFNKAEVTIGRVQGNDIVLPKGNVSKRHARIVLKDGKFIIVDQKSTNGTYVNGRKITSPQVVKDADKIYIGDFIIAVDESSVGVAVDAAPEAPSAPVPQAPPPQAPPPQAPPAYARPPEPAPAPVMRPRESVPPPMAAPAPPPMRPSAQMAPQMPPQVVPPMPAPAPAPAPPPAYAAPRPQPATQPPPAMPAPAPVAMPVAMPAPAPVAMPVAMPAPAPAPVPMPAPQAPAPAMTTADPRPRAPMAAATSAAAPVGVPITTVTPIRPVTGVRSAPTVRGARVEPLDARAVRLLEIQHDLLEQVRQKLELDNVAIDRLGDEALWQSAERTIAQLVETYPDLPKPIDHGTLVKETLNEALGLGPLEDLLADPKVEEIYVDRRDRILVGTGGVLRASGRAFSSEDALTSVLDRLVAPLGRVIDELEPVVDVRLRDGSRLTAMVPPVATQGACLILRKARPAQPTMADLVGAGALSPTMADYLVAQVHQRRNILVCGAPGAGKTSLIGALAQAAPVGERVITVEEFAELGLARPDWISLEARPGDAKSAPVDLSQVIRAALRLAPDRLVVGDVVGRDALTVLTALSSTIDGAIVGATGDGVAAGLSRVATLARTATADLTDAGARELTGLAFEIAVHVVRHPDGIIRVQAIEKVAGGGAAGFQTQPVYGFAGTQFAELGPA